MVAQGIELVPAGADQRRHLPPLDNGLGGIAPMFQSVAVAWLATTALTSAVHSAAHLPAHSRLLAWRLPPSPGMASGCLVHT